MRRRLSVGEGAIGKRQSLVNSTKRPQDDGVPNLSCGAGIHTEPVGEIAVACRVVELDGLQKMFMGAGKVAEIPTGLAGNAVRDQGLAAIRPDRGFT